MARKNAHVGTNETQVNFDSNDTIRNSVVIEMPSWDSARLSAMLSAILLKEKIGYQTVLVQTPGDSSTAYKRLSHSSDDSHLRPVNLVMEIWQYNFEAEKLWVDTKSEVLRMGDAGYVGRVGLYVNTWAFNKTNLITPSTTRPDYWFDTWRGLKSAKAIEELDLGVDVVARWGDPQNRCESDAVRARENQKPAGCNNGDGTFRTPECTENRKNGRGCVTLVGITEDWDLGMLQQVSVNLHLPIEVAWLGDQHHVTALVRNRTLAGRSVLFYGFIPTKEMSNTAAERVALPNPTPACQKARTFEPSGGANCDFDYLKLGKFLSSSLQNTPAEVFVRESILQDGSMDDMLRSLGQKDIASPPALMDHPAREVRERAYHEACRWIRTNYMTWKTWIDPRVMVAANSKYMTFSLANDAAVVNKTVLERSSGQGSAPGVGYIPKALHALSRKFKFNYTINLNYSVPHCKGLGYCDEQARTTCERLLANDGIDLAPQGAIVKLSIPALLEGGHPCNHPKLLRLGMFRQQGLGILINDGQLGPTTKLVAIIEYASHGLLTVFCAFVLTVTGVAHCMWCAERGENSEQFPVDYLEGIDDSCWWGIVTSTTVGYGDKAPVTASGRCVAIVWMLVGLVLFAYLTGSITSAMEHSDAQHITKLLDINPLTELGVMAGIEGRAQEILAEIDYGSLRNCTNQDVDKSRDCVELLDKSRAQFSWTSYAFPWRGETWSVPLQINALIGPLPELVHEVAMRKKDGNGDQGDQPFKVTGQAFDRMYTPAYYLFIRTSDASLVSWVDTSNTQNGLVDTSNIDNFLQSSKSMLSIETEYFGAKARDGEFESEEVLDPNSPVLKKLVQQEAANGVLVFLALFTIALFMFTQFRMFDHVPCHNAAGAAKAKKARVARRISTSMAGRAVSRLTLGRSSRSAPAPGPQAIDMEMHLVAEQEKVGTELSPGSELTLEAQ